MSDEEQKIIDFILERVEEIGGKFYFTARSLSGDFECEEGLKRLSRASLNKDLVWRHRHPLNKEDKDMEIFGRVDESHVDNGYIVSRYEAYTHTPRHLAFIDLVKKRLEAKDPLGISMHYRKYTIDGKPIHYDVFEHSGTPIPACKTCLTTNYGVKTMAKEEKNKEQIEEVKNEDPKDEDAELEILKKIEDLENILDEKTKKLEDYKVKVESLELEMKKKAEEIEAKTEKAKTVEERVLELEGQIDFLKKKPFLDKLLEVRTLDDKEKEWYGKQDVAYLKTKYEEAKKEAETKPHTKSLEESAQENVDKTDKELENKEKDVKVSFDKFTKYLSLNNKK